MKAGNIEIIAFGNLAIMAPEEALDPWLCVPIFRWVCPYRRDLIYFVINIIGNIAFDRNCYIINFITSIAFDRNCVNRIEVPRLCSPIGSCGLPLSGADGDGKPVSRWKRLHWYVAGQEGTIRWLATTRRSAGRGSRTSTSRRSPSRASGRWPPSVRLVSVTWGKGEARTSGSDVESNTATKSEQNHYKKRRNKSPKRSPNVLVAQEEGCQQTSPHLTLKAESRDSTAPPETCIPMSRRCVVDLLRTGEYAARKRAQANTRSRVYVGSTPPGVLLGGQLLVSGWPLLFT